MGALDFPEFRGQGHVLLYGGTNPPIRIGEENTLLPRKYGEKFSSNGGNPQTGIGGQDLPEIRGTCPPMSPPKWIWAQSSQKLGAQILQWGWGYMAT